MVISFSVERVTMASLLVMVGSISTPMDITRQPQNTSSTTAAPNGAQRCWKHHSRLLTYFSCTLSNHLSSLGLEFFSRVEEAAGATVRATMREAARQ